ncbi:MAG TPA: CaiB/BaiF CoA-transferase family protein [Methylomirabilota bacterium]|nr:CaiB/BaiF CoA-transferase family protein [Methylomirabilota bacterium]
MGVLDGIKVLELARVPPAEMPGMIMADMGADVLKIETPEPDRKHDERWVRQTIHAFVNRNKRSMALNMKAPQGQAIFQKLAKSADVIVEGFRPGVMDRLGAGYEALRESNPRLIYCSLSGFGQDGPYKNYPAHDMNYLSLAGVLNLIGEAGSKKPVIPLNLVADYAGASLHGALGIVLALYAREKTGRGQHVDVSYLDTTLSLLAATPNMRFFFSDGVAPRRGEGFLGGSYPYYAIYETRDRKLLTIGCTEPWLWENVCKAIGHPEYTRFARQPDQFVRAANAEESAAREAIEAIIKTRDRDDWYDFLVKHDVCVGKVYDVEEMVQDPQINHRQMIVDVEHPTHGRVRQFGIAIKLSDTPGTVRTAAPLSGEHTEAILKDLGLKADEIAGLRQKKVIE